MPPLLACREDELDEGHPLVVSVGKRRLVVTRWQGEVFAVRDVCPHMTSSFGRGRVRGVIRPEAGDLVLDDGQPMLRCPWHGWEFSLRSGQCLVDPALRVRAYETIVKDGEVFVVLEERGIRAREPDAAEAMK